MTNTLALFREGRLGDAIAQTTDAVKHQPTDTHARSLLAELLCIQGNFERADHQLETLAELDGQRQEEVNVWRNLLRAAQARTDVFEHGAAPELTREASGQVRGLLDALIAWRKGESGVADRYEALEAHRSPWPASVDSRSVDDVRELDDRLAGVVDVLTTQGQYLWLDVSDIASLRLVPRRRPIDAIWRPAHLTLNDGFNGRVYVPIIYPTPTDDEAALLGQRTEWLEQGGAVIGVGQRCWLVEDNALPLGEINSLDCATPAGATASVDAEASS